MYHAEEAYLAATAEWMNLHVDMRTRRVAPWPSAVLAKIADFASAQGARPMPDEAGRRMSVPAPMYSSDGYPS
jgi:acyl-CoA thioester hydrolase